MIIMGIDPGTARVGWGVIETVGNSPTARLFGCVETDPRKDPEYRLKEIFDDLTGFIKKQKPDTIALEAIFFATNAKTVIPVAEARGVVLLAAANTGVPVVSYTPRVVKQTICGSGSADKLQIQKMVMRLLKLSTIPRPDDAADALAIALTHAYSYKLKGKLK